MINNFPVWFYQCFIENKTSICIREFFPAQGIPFEDQYNLNDESYTEPLTNIINRFDKIIKVIIMK